MLRTLKRGLEATRDVKQPLTGCCTVLLRLITRSHAHSTERRGLSPSWASCAAWTGQGAAIIPNTQVRTNPLPVTAACQKPSPPTLHNHSDTLRSFAATAPPAGDLFVAMLDSLLMDTGTAAATHVLPSKPTASPPTPFPQPRNLRRTCKPSERQEKTLPPLPNGL